ncbi:ABC transporter ATP-binding protein [Cellulomonas phragmiteti]|uniref:ABC transporter ATP-binding protein n=1 Tax=Cellulomonas phragmiteti TaxID=478780 RepID=A0ABQ4DP91_9CELL|nr:ABC transporter ATP-binding protein [Cellulomonas phragmiteti]
MPPAEVAPVLHAVGVGVRHGRVDAVTDVTLAVAAGDKVALVGPNGSGKTTLLRVLGGLCTPTSGIAHLDGADLRRVPGPARARRLAFVGQDEQGDLPFTARDVLLLGRAVRHPDWRPYDDADHAAVDALLDRWELAPLASRGLDEMSGGERRRVLLARAFAQGGDVLLLDEPTNHLDLRHQHALLAHVADAPGTAVVALHDLDLAAAYCTRVVMLARGRVVADGPAPQVLTAARVGEVYGVDARAVDLGGRHHLLVGR